MKPAQRDLVVLEERLAELLEYLDVPITRSPAKRDRVESTPGRRRGPKPDLNALEEFANVIAPYGEDWKKADLDDLFGELDKAGVPVPKTWRRRDPPAKSWEDGYLLYGVIAVQAAEYRYNNARKKLSRIFATVAGPR
jgi:hypothetical protein